MKDRERMDVFFANSTPIKQVVVVVVVVVIAILQMSAVSII